MKALSLILFFALASFCCGLVDKNITVDANVDIPAAFQPVLSNGLITLQLGASSFSHYNVFNGRELNASNVETEGFVHLAHIPSPLTNISVLSPTTHLELEKTVSSLDLTDKFFMRSSLSTDKSVQIEEYWTLDKEAATLLTYEVRARCLHCLKEEIFIIDSNVFQKLNNSFEDLFFSRSMSTHYHYVTRSSECDDVAPREVSLHFSQPLPVQLTLNPDHPSQTVILTQSVAVHPDVAPPTRVDLKSFIRVDAKGSPPTEFGAFLHVLTKSSFYSVFSQYAFDLPAMGVSSYGGLLPQQSADAAGFSARQAGLITPEMDLYLLPLAQWVAPEFAAQMLHYRQAQRDAASKNAVAAGGAGDTALFAWASAASGVDVLALPQPLNASLPDEVKELSQQSTHALFRNIFIIKNVLDRYDAVGDWAEIREHFLDSCIAAAKFLMARASDIGPSCEHYAVYLDTEIERPAHCYTFANVFSLDAHTHTASGVNSSSLTDGAVGHTLYRLAQYLRQHSSESDAEVANLESFALAVNLVYDNSTGLHPEYSGYGGQAVSEFDTTLLQFPLKMSYSSFSALDSDLKWKELDYYNNRLEDSGVWTPSVFPTVTALLRSGHPLKAGTLLKKVFAAGRTPFALWRDYGGAANYLPMAAGWIHTLIFGFGGFRVHEDYYEIAPIDFSAAGLDDLAGSVPLHFPLHNWIIDITQVETNLYYGFLGKPGCPSLHLEKLDGAGAVISSYDAETGSLGGRCSRPCSLRLSFGKGDSSSSSSSSSSTSTSTSSSSPLPESDTHHFFFSRTTVLVGVGGALLAVVGLGLFFRDRCKKQSYRAIP